MPHLRRALLGAALLFLLGSVSPIGGLPIAGAVSVRAASPAPSQGAGDTRSTGEAPGFVGSPLVAVVSVLALGAIATLATIAYVRLTGGPGRAGQGPSAPPG